MQGTHEIDDRVMLKVTRWAKYRNLAICLCAEVNSTQNTYLGTVTVLKASKTMLDDSMGMGMIILWCVWRNKIITLSYSVLLNLFQAQIFSAK